MGQVIQFQPSVGPYPKHHSGLDDPEAVLRAGLRWWVEHTRRQHDALVERALRTALLTAQGADMALGPLQGIGRLFSSARLFFCSRAAPVDVAASPHGEAKLRRCAAILH